MMKRIENIISKILTGNELKTIDEKYLEMSRKEKFYAKKDLLEKGVILYYSILGGIAGFAIGMISGRRLLSHHIFGMGWVYTLSVIVTSSVVLLFMSFIALKFFKPEYNRFKDKYDDLINKTKPNNDIYKYKSKIIRKSYINDIKHMFVALFCIILLLVIIIYPLMVEPSFIVEYPLILPAIGWFVFIFWCFYTKSYTKILERDEAIERIRNSQSNVEGG